MALKKNNFLIVWIEYNILQWSRHFALSGLFATVSVTLPFRTNTTTSQNFLLPCIYRYICYESLVSQTKIIKKEKNFSNPNSIFCPNSLFQRQPWGDTYQNSFTTQLGLTYQIPFRWDPSLSLGLFSLFFWWCNWSIKLVVMDWKLTFWNTSMKLTESFMPCQISGINL